LNRFVPVQQQTISVNNTNTIKLTGSLTVNIGDIITQPLTGARALVTDASTGSNIRVTTLTNILTNTQFVTLTVDTPITANTGEYITQVTSGANISVYQTVSNSTSVYGYINSGTFDTINYLAVNGSIGTAIPTGTGSANIFITTANSTGTFDTKFYANVTYGVSTTDKLYLNFTPAVAGDPNSLLIKNASKTFIPGIEYTLSGNVVSFTSNVVQSDISITQQPYYTRLTSVSGNADSRFGYALSSSFDGAQLAVGAPDDTVIGLKGAGSVWVYDRIIESFDSTGLQDYVTKNPIAAVYKVTVDTIETTDYFVTTTNTPRDTIRFITPPPVGHVIYVEVNQFALLERLIGIDSLEGGLTAIQSNAAFGTSLTICSNNCAIYVGAPNYDAGTLYNSGAVWKFHNRGRLYGTNTGYAVDPVFTPGDSIRLNNFEVIVSGRLMPTTLANGYSASILTVSSNIRANVGQVISQNQGSGNYANVTVLANTSVTGSKFITVGDYTTAYTFKFGQSSASANVVTVNNTSTSAYPMASLDSLVKDINDAGILGVTAVNQAGSLRLNSDVTVAKDQLRILSGTVNTGSLGVYHDADLIIFAFMQIIINPYHAAGEYFGSKVKLASNAYMLVIGSGQGTTRAFTTFDSDTTTFDVVTTRLFDKIPSSGSVYIYELYDDPRNEVEHPGRYAFCQQLDPDTLAPGAQFGYALDIEGPYIVITAPGDSSIADKSGSVYVFSNPKLARGWQLIRYQSPKVDVDSVSRIYLYSNQTNTILDSLQYIDPAKGRILGQAEQEISFKTEYDPAIYNQGNNPAADINAKVYWGVEQVGKVWWNLSEVRYLDYEQDTLTYRSINWGQLFPGSVIEVLEWVESSVLPSRYVASGGSGVPKYADDSAYVEIIHVDPVTNIIGTKYYYWVKDKTTVDPNDNTRLLPIQSIQGIIENPKSQGIAYAAVIQNNAISLYNVGEYLSAKNTVLHIDHDLLINTNLIHSEYELIQKGNANGRLPAKIINKLIDSLAGIDSNGSTVPDPTLSVADRYGIDVRPRQSMFVDRLTAAGELVAYVNDIFAVNPIAKEFDLTQMTAEEPIPSVTQGIYDYELGAYVPIGQSVAVDSDLAYLDTGALSTGYKVLVLDDTTQDDLWVIYQLTSVKTWEIYRVQSYKTGLYWSYIDWYATGYDSTTKPNFAAETTVDALKLGAVAGEIIKINNATGDGTWQLVIVNSDGTFKVIGIQNGTIQLNSSLGDYVNNQLGFDNQEFDLNRYDQNPNIEMRSIISALRDDIFINTLQGKFNDLFFVMVNYLFTEQKYVDWIFKSSFISVKHQLRTLSQFPSYVQDNQTYYQSYIDEVKPYRTKVREYLIDYTGSDSFNGTITDFDLPSYYDTLTSRGIFRSPSGEAPYIDSDEALWQTFPYNQWYKNRTLEISEIVVENTGYGYTIPPTVTIFTSTGAPTTAKATAILDTETGAIARIRVDNPGSKFSQIPQVVVIGACVIPATAYAVLTNAQVRSISTKLKFDRITYNSKVQQWKPNTFYHQGDIITYANRDGDIVIRKSYVVNEDMLSGATFLASDYTPYASSAFSNANDRILGYYQPSLTMPSIETTTISLVNANAAVNSDAIYVFNASGVFNGMRINSDGYSSNIVSILPNVSINYSNIDTKVTKLTLGSAVTLDANVEIIASYNSLGQLISGIEYPGVQLSGLSFNQQPGYAMVGFDDGVFDNIQYDSDGSPILGDDILDNIIRSNYTDSALGLRAEDIIIDGSGYVDQYSSHAPEELVPGIIFDTLAIKVYTQINDGTEVLGYRIFNNMLRQTKYLRIADAYTTTLTANLNYSDAEMFVSNSSVFTKPDIALGVPGVVFVGAERITYWRNYKYDVVPWASSTAYANTAILSYGNVITFNNTISVNVNDYIVQPTSGANAKVIALGLDDKSVYVAYNSGTFTLGSGNVEITGVGFAEIEMSGAISANVGDYITQSTSGANLRVVANVSASANVLVSYYGEFTITTSYGNIQINGADVAVYPFIANVDGLVPEDITPITSDPAYFITTNVMPAASTFNNTRVAILPDLNVLAQLRRGTEGTSVGNQYPIGDLIVDASIYQVVPNTAGGNVTLSTANTYQSADTVSYTMALSGNVSANIGEAITQASSSASATIVGKISGNTTTLLLQYTSSVAFKPAEVIVTLNANLSASLSANIIANIATTDFTVTQASTGAELTVANIISNNKLSLIYSNAYNLSLGVGNISINGQDALVYPVISTVSTPESPLAINGILTANVYPLNTRIQGNISATGTVSIAANTTLQTTTSWYNLGVGIPTDTTGFEGAITAQVLFLKDKVATFNSEYTTPSQLGTEDGLNTLITEDGIDEIYGG
jgi:hypothetical protein